MAILCFYVWGSEWGIQESLEIDATEISFNFSNIYLKLSQKGNVGVSINLLRNFRFVAVQCKMQS